MPFLPHPNRKRSERSFKSPSGHVVNSTPGFDAERRDSESRQKDGGRKIKRERFWRKLKWNQQIDQGFQRSHGWEFCYPCSPREMRRCKKTECPCVRLRCHFGATRPPSKLPTGPRLQLLLREMPWFLQTLAMLARVLSAALSRQSAESATADVNGVEAFPVEVEVNTARGDTTFD